MERIDNDGKWIIENGIEILTEPSNEWIQENQPEPTREQLLVPIRLERNRLLAETDWTQLPDTQLTDSQRIAWRQYRQELRDLPETVAANNPVWPTKPM